jgi:tetratricopeptide (TPR) repeat protein
LGQREENEAKTFMAFSLNVAKARITKAQGKGLDFRQVFPEVYRLGYMTRPLGLIFDSLSGDTILIGEKGKTSNLFLDDFVSALRSLYIYGVYPQLTIDPEGETPDAEWHQVRMTKGIESSHFGQVFFESDYLLKKISQNLVKIKVPRFKTQYQLMIEQRSEDATYSRFWFKPSGVDVLVSENAVFINSYPVRVLSETLYPAHLKDKVAVKFARSFSQRFDEFAKYWPVFEDLRNLLSWVGIAGSLSSMNFAPDLKFWLADYEIKKVQIPERVKGLNNIYGDLDSLFKICGGIDSAFLSLRLKTKDTTALVDLTSLVINSRPSSDTLTWEYPLQEYRLPPPLKLEVDVSRIERLLAEGLLLVSRKEYEKAIENFNKAIEIEPDFYFAWDMKGGLLHDLGRYQEALICYDKILKINPQDFTTWYNKGEVLEYLKRSQESVRAYEMFLELAPAGDPDIEKARDKIRRAKEDGGNK